MNGITPAHRTELKIALAADHRGFPTKEIVKKWLLANGYQVSDFGTDQNATKVDVQDFAVPVCHAVRGGTADIGIIVCMTGQVSAVIANRHVGIVAAQCTDATMARLAREHNGSNVLALGGWIVGEEVVTDIVRTFLATVPLGLHYTARREKLAQFKAEN